MRYGEVQRAHAPITFIYAVTCGPAAFVPTASESYVKRSPLSAMAFKRKPVPRSRAPQEDASNQRQAANPSPSGYNASGSHTATPQDGPDPALSEAYEDIRNAVARMTGDGRYDEERAPLVPDQRNSD